MKKTLFCTVTLIFALAPGSKSFASTDFLGEARSAYTPNQKESSIEVTENGTIRKCLISGKVEQAKLSTDNSVVIISGNTYIPTSKLKNCGANPIAPRKTPSKSGFLVDINLSRKIYIALFPVTTQPMMFLATVSSLGSSKSIVTLPGAYVPGSSIEQQRQSAFAYSEEGGPQARISRSGRYVSVNGVIECSENSYPGIWDIRRNKKVVISDDPSYLKCMSLFE